MKAFFPCYCLETPESARRLPKPALFRRCAAGLLWPALFAVFGLAPGAFADSTTWSNTGTGSWADAENWTGGVPGSNDDAEVNNGGTVRLETGASGNPFRILLGGTLGGSSGSLEIAGGTLTAFNAYIAYALGSTGSVTVTDGGSWSNSSPLYVGYYGPGTLTINSGFVQNTYGYLGSTSFGVGSATVTSGTWINTGPLTVGRGGTGTLLVNSGLVQSASGLVGESGSGSVTVKSGSWINSGTLTVGGGGTGTLTIDGGLVQNSLGWVGNYANSNGSVTVNSGTWWNTNLLRVGASGTGSLTINNGLVRNTTSFIGDDMYSSGTVTVVSGTWMNNNGTLTIGNLGAGTLVINGGLVQNEIAWVGNASTSKSSVTVTSGTWMNTSDLYLGFGGSGTLTVNGGLVQNRIGRLGVASGTGTAIVSSGTWVNTGSTTVGSSGRGSTLTIQTGGVVLTGGSALIGEGSSSFPTSGSGNRALVTGDGSTWKISNGLIVGKYGSNNLLTVTDGALVQIGNSADDTLQFSTQGSSANNFLRVNEGYIALFGDQVETFEDLIADGVIQLWTGSTWVVSTDTADFTITYFTTDEDAKGFTAYDNLGGYTILTATVIPEPGAISLLALGVALLFQRRSVGRTS